MIIKGEDASEILAECERLEKKIGDNPASILYSEAWEVKRSYMEMVLEMEKGADDFLYSLSDGDILKLDSLKQKTVSDIISFAERKR